MRAGSASISDRALRASVSQVLSGMAEVRPEQSGGRDALARRRPGPNSRSSQSRDSRLHGSFTDYIPANFEGGDSGPAAFRSFRCS